MFLKTIALKFCPIFFELEIIIFATLKQEYTKLFKFLDNYFFEYPTNSKKTQINKNKTINREYDECSNIFTI